MPVPVHQLKVTLDGVQPPVWRRLQLPSSATLAQLHQVIQVVMGWEGYHLHSFGDSVNETTLTLELVQLQLVSLLSKATNDD